MTNENLIPAGYYDAVVVPVKDDKGNEVKVQFGISKSDTKQCLVHFEILNGPHAGQRLPWYGSFTRDAGKRSIESLRYCGFKGDQLIKINEQELFQAVSVTVEHHEWEEKVHARIAWVNKTGGGQAKFATPMTEQELRAYSATCQATLKGIPEHEGVAAERAEPNGKTTGATAKADSKKEDDDPFGSTPNNSTPPQDDDIPF